MTDEYGCCIDEKVKDEKNIELIIKHVNRIRNVFPMESRKINLLDII